MDQAPREQSRPLRPVKNIGQAFADEQVKARNLEVKQAFAGINTAQSAIKTISTVACPMRLTATPPALRRAPPALGEHKDAVPSELGLSDKAIEGLRASGIV